MGEAQNIRYIQRSLYRISVFIQIIPVKLFVSYVISRDLLAFVISRFVIDRFYCSSYQVLGSPDQEFGQFPKLCYT